MPAEANPVIRVNEQKKVNGTYSDVPEWNVTKNTGESTITVTVPPNTEAGTYRILFFWILTFIGSMSFYAYKKVMIFISGCCIMKEADMQTIASKGDPYGTDISCRRR